MAKNPTQQKVVTKKHLARVERERRQRRILLTVAGAVIGLILIVLAYGLIDQFVLKQYRTVAEVNNEKITMKEFQNQVRFTRWQMVQQYQSSLEFYQFFASDPTFAQSIQSQLQQMAANLSPDNAATLGGDVLDAMIDDELVRQEAANRGITVTEEEVDKAMQEAFGFYANGTPTPGPTSTPVVTSTLNPTQLALIPPTPEATEEPTPDPEAEVTPTEAAAEGEAEQEPEAEVESTPIAEPTPLESPTPFPTATPYTVEGYQGRLNETVDDLMKIGFTETDLRNTIRTQLLRQKLYDAMTADVPRTEDQVWARHILVEDEQTALAIIDQYRAGADWNTLAAENSTDTSNSANGGDLGWFGRGSMVEEFENVAFDMEVGEVSPPVQTRFGFHIIQVLGHEERPLTADEYESARRAAFQEWLDSLKTEETVKKYDNWSGDVPVQPAIPSELAF